MFASEGKKDIRANRTFDGGLRMWYSANLLFKSSVLDGRQLPRLCEASIRLVRAGNKEDAIRKAEQIGGRGEHSYVNNEGHKVNWEFVKLLEIQELCETSIYDGIEVYSRMFYDKDDEDVSK